MSSVVSTQYTSVTDRQTDRQTPHHSIYRAMHMRRAVKLRAISCHQRTVAWYGGCRTVVIVTNPAIVTTAQIPSVQRSITRYDHVIASLDWPRVSTFVQRQVWTTKYCKQPVQFNIMLPFLRLLKHDV